MTSGFVKRIVSFSVAWRLAAGALPSLLAVALVVGLFYYGKLNRAAPRVVLGIAAALTAISLAIAWANARYFANRIARLARVAEPVAGGTGRTDEFDRIEAAVGSLGSALSASEAQRAKADVIAGAQRRDEATMLAGVVADSLSRLDEVRLPLHILLESRFGELNENQEELLRDARTAADAIDVALRRLGQVADADRGAVTAQKELVQVNDVVRSVLPLARAAAERRGARLDTSLEPGLPRVVADRARLAEALALFAVDAAEASGPERPLTISTARAGQAAIIRLSPAGQRELDQGPPIFAARLISVQGGTVSVDAEGLSLRVGQ